MNARARGPRLSRLLARIVLGWVLALGPMVAGLASAATFSPEHGTLCRGLGRAVSERGQHPDDTRRDHGQCCLAGCNLSALGGPTGPAHLAFPPSLRSLETGEGPTRDALVRRAGLGPQSARAPPVSLSL